MTDEDFLTRFEDTTLEPFHHCDHVRVVWLYLDRYSLLETLAKFSEGLKRYAAAHGKPNRYHETITWCYVLLINERRQRLQEAPTWEAFSQLSPDLMDWQNSVLTRYYNAATLASDLARKTFVFPDKAL